MKYKIYTLLPNLFKSFLDTGLVARGISKNIINFEIINWRESFGIGNYKQIDDKPFGGGSGMVLMPNPIIECLNVEGSKSQMLEYKENYFQTTKNLKEYSLSEPNNPLFYDFYRLSKIYSLNPQLDLQSLSTDNPQIIHRFEQYFKTDKKTVIQTISKNPPKKISKVNLYLTPRGYRFNQKVATWLSEFQEISIICGRYEGLDYRALDQIDLEISLGDFVLNGGEVAAMSLIESVSRLIPGFISKQSSVEHDSFSKSLNIYNETLGYSKYSQPENQNDPFLWAKEEIDKDSNLFDYQEFLEKLPQLEHPQFTRPEVWNNIQIPQVLLSGNHKLIQDWRIKVNSQFLANYD